MKKFAYSVLLIACFVTFGYIYSNHIPIWPRLQNILRISAPCYRPLKYSVGDIDPRFHLSKNEVMAAAQQAAQIWNTTSGKELLAYDPEAQLKIEFSYDARQSLNTKINQMEGSLDAQGNAIKPKISQYQQQETAFRKKLAAFNAEVANWNQKGGAPPDVYAKLNQEQKDLQAEANQLNATARQLNISTSTYNSQVGALNKTIDTFNAELEKRPEEGLFSPDDNTITIYFSSSPQELVHTLAHELGHAIGLQHVGDSKAIMYTFTNQSVKPTSEDSSAVKALCS